MSQRQRQADAHGVAVHGRDHRLAHLPRRRIDTGGAEGLLILLGEGILPGTHVGAGAEGLAGAGQHHGPDGVVLVAPPVGIAQLHAHPAAEGIEMLRAVQLDDGHWPR
jgi:hypothetical protein